MGPGAAAGRIDDRSPDARIDLDPAPTPEQLLDHHAGGGREVWPQGASPHRGGLRAAPDRRPLPQEAAVASSPVRDGWVKRK